MLLEEQSSSISEYLWSKILSGFKRPKCGRWMTVLTKCLVKKTNCRYKISPLQREFGDETAVPHYFPAQSFSTDECGLAHQIGCPVGKANEIISSSSDGKRLAQTISECNMFHKEWRTNTEITQTKKTSHKVGLQGCPEAETETFCAISKCLSPSRYFTATSR